MAAIGKLQFSLEGDKELAAYFQNLGKAASGKIIRKIARNATKVAFDEIQRHTPNDTGFTANRSLYIRTDRKKKQGQIAYVIGFRVRLFKKKEKIYNRIYALTEKFKSRHRKGFKGFVNRLIKITRKALGTVAGHKITIYRRFHPWMIEFGTSKRAARPFFRPAWERAKPRVVSYWRKELRSLLKL